MLYPAHHLLKLLANSSNCLVSSQICNTLNNHDRRNIESLIMSPTSPSSPRTSPPRTSPPHSPTRSETTQLHRRPRSPVPPQPCVCNRPNLPTSPTTTTTTTSTFIKPTHPIPPSPNCTPAITFAASSSKSLHRAGPAAACQNATTLSKLLAHVVAALDDQARTFWCQMMDTLALRTAAGDVQYSVAIAPHLPWLAEQVYATHHPTLRIHPNNLCQACGGFRLLSLPSSPLTNHALSIKDDTSLQFSWVDDDDDDDDIGNTQRIPVASFEAYICDVLDEHGKNEFVRERYYGGVPINTRYLLAKFGTSLGMTPDEVQLLAADLIHDEEEIPFQHDDYMSGVSDVESQDRSDNGV